MVRVAATCIVTRVTVTMVTSAVPQEDAADWFGFDLTEHHGHFGGLEGFNSFGRKPGKKKYIKVLLLQGNNIVKHPIPVYSNFKFKYVKYFFLKYHVAVGHNAVMVMDIFISVHIALVGCSPSACENTTYLCNKL